MKEKESERAKAEASLKKKAQDEAIEAEELAARHAQEASRLGQEWEKAQVLAETETILRKVGEQLHESSHDARQEHLKAEDAHRKKIEQIRRLRTQKREHAASNPDEALRITVRDGVKAEGHHLPTFGQR